MILADRAHKLKPPSAEVASFLHIFGEAAAFVRTGQTRIFNTSLIDMAKGGHLESRRVNAETCNRHAIDLL